MSTVNFLSNIHGVCSFDPCTVCFSSAEQPPKIIVKFRWKLGKLGKKSPYFTFDFAQLSLLAQYACRSRFLSSRGGGVESSIVVVFVPSSNVTWIIGNL